MENHPFVNPEGASDTPGVEDEGEQELRNEKENEGEEKAREEEEDEKGLDPAIGEVRVSGC